MRRTTATNAHCYLSAVMLTQNGRTLCMAVTQDIA